jgi:taurine dioxygenase
MKLSCLSPHIGAEISGADLCAELDDEAARQLRQALCKHQMLVIRSQPLSADQQVKLARVFGEPMPDSHPKFGCVDGNCLVALVINDHDNPPDINVWHTDTTFKDPPAGVCVLHCVETPPAGGNTIWASMTAAYEALSEPMKRFLEPLTAYHQLPLDGRPPELIATVMGKEIAATHPIIRWIPEIEKPSLFVNRIYTRRIEDLASAESEAVLQGLFAVCESPDHQVRLSWNAGDTVIWDNRSTQHYAVADYWPNTRVMHRVAVNGESVIPYSSQ